MSFRTALAVRNLLVRNNSKFIGRVFLMLKVRTEAMKGETDI